MIEAPGTSVKGSVELDDNGEVLTANFPIFNLSDGDKAMLKAERGPDGALRVMMRGDVYDGRISSSRRWAARPRQSKQEAKDVDLDVKLGTVVGFHGETLRGLDLRLSRRGGAIKSFALSAKLGRDAALNGDLRGRNGGRQVIYIDARTPAPSSASPTPTARFSAARCGWRWTRRPPRSRRRTACSTSAISRCAARRRSTGWSPAPPAASGRASISRACGSSSPARPAASRSAKGS